MPPTKAWNNFKFNYPKGSCAVAVAHLWVPFATTLQPADSTPYSRPYVAEYSHSDSAFDPRDRLCLADTRRADAATEK
jgi:hypothetical protein